MKFKIDIVIFGRFHFFDLAKSLQDQGCDVNLISSMPKSVYKKWGIASNSKLLLILFEIWKRMLLRLQLWYPFVERLTKQSFGIAARRYIRPDTDCVIFFAGNSYFGNYLKSISRNRSSNPLFICDEGSAHPLTQRALLNEVCGADDKPRISCEESVIDTMLEYDFSDVLVVPSTFVRDSILSHNPLLTKIHINPYGVDLNLFYPKSWVKEGNSFKFIFVGYASQQKGIPLLFRAFSELVLDGADISLVLVGGIEPHILDIYRKLPTSVSQHISFQGPVSQDFLVDYYSQADAFILPSVQDGFGMVLVQAAACGLPIIASSNTGVFELKEIGGVYIFPNNDVDVLKKHMAKLISEDSIKCTSARAEAVKSKFSWESYGLRYMSILTKHIYNEDC